jgi:hypothetical protein
MSKILCLFFCLTLSVSCLANEVSKEGFAIYVIKTPEGKSLHGPDLGGVDLPVLPVGSKPLFGLQDIISYSASQHSMILKKKAYLRFEKNELNYRGQEFAVCVERKPIYFGKFWEDIWSVSCPDVVIVYEPAQDEAASKNCISLRTGYPTSTYFVGRDQRSDQRILKSLRDAGKLVK